MKRKLNMVGLMGVAVLFAALTVFAAGCAEVVTLSDWVSEVPRGHDWVSDSVTGEGWLPTDDGGVRATFSFQLRYVDAHDGFVGVLAFTDEVPWRDGKKVDLRGAIDRATVDDCRVVLYGTYEPQPQGLARAEGGELIVTVSCGEYFSLYGILEPTFDISLDDGTFAGYNCGGVIREGNINLESGE